MNRSPRRRHQSSERDNHRILVLVVDDESGMRAVTVGLLESNSDRITATAVADAEEALAHLAAEPVDCIVCDYQMPGLDGLELLERVRRDYGDLPFVLFTGKGSEEIASEAISRGVTDYLQKGQDADRFAILANRTENAADQYRAEQELERERVRRAALFEDTDPIVEVVFEGEEPVVTGVNSAFEHVFGLEETTIVGQQVSDLLVPDAEREAHRSLSRRVREGTIVEAEVRRQTADGVRDFSLRVVPMPEADSDAYAWYTDITERKERERELQRQNERLEEFASVLSHDLRNPLMVARGGVALARENGSMDDLDRVEQAHERMEALIADILTLAVQGQAVEDASPQLLVPLIEAAWETIDHEGATLDVTLDRDARITADPGRLRQVLENLLSNAVEHGSTGSRPSADDAVEHGSTNHRSHAPEDAVKHGSTRPRSQAHEDAAEHDRTGEDATVAVRVGPLETGFFVEDDGPGLPPTEREAVFDQGYSTTARGTGFGLAIVQDIAEAHGWTVTVTDGADGGARFEMHTGRELQ